MELSSDMLRTSRIAECIQLGTAFNMRHHFSYPKPSTLKSSSVWPRGLGFGGSRVKELGRQGIGLVCLTDAAGKEGFKGCSVFSADFF